jgi:hypothetical protein
MTNVPPNATNAAVAGDGGWLPWDGPAGISAAGSNGLGGAGHDAHRMPDTNSRPPHKR